VTTDWGIKNNKMHLGEIVLKNGGQPTSMPKKRRGFTTVLREAEEGKKKVSFAKKMKLSATVWCCKKKPRTKRPHTYWGLAAVLLNEKNSCCQ